MGSGIQNKTEASQQRTESNQNGFRNIILKLISEHGTK